MTREAIVVGGGIAGLAAAVALRREGWEPVVLERAAHLEVRGGGIVLAANALEALDLLGVGDTVRARGSIAHTVRVRSRSGRVLFEYEYAAAGEETLGVHRADLQDALRAALPAAAVRLGVQVDGVHAAGEVALEEGTTERAQLVVGADGIHSAVRTSLFGPQPLRYAGHAAWRGVASFEHELADGVFTETWGPGNRFGIVPIGGGRVYWYVAETAPEGSPAPDRSLAELRDRFAGWHEPIPQLLVAADAEPSRTFVYDLRPLRRWTLARVALLGDAAHAMTPNLGQGAAMGLEDAVVLGASLRLDGEVESALRSYEQRRKRRAHTMLRRSRQAGRLAHLDSRLACRLRDALVAAAPRAFTARRQRALVRWSYPAPTTPSRTSSASSSSE